VTGVQLRTGSRRTHRRTPHPHSGQCGRATELGAARCEEAKEEAHEQQLYRGLVGAGASSSPTASSAHVRSAAPPRPRGHACEQLRRGLASRTEREAEVVAHPLGSSCSGELGVKAMPSLWCVPHLGAGRWSSGHGRWSSGELSPIQVLKLEDEADEWGPPETDRCRGTQLSGMEREEQGRGSNDISRAQTD